MIPKNQLAESAPYRDALYQSIEHWGLRFDGAILLRDGVNHVYATETIEGAPVIVRVSDGDHRFRPELEAELRWLDWLIAHDCVVTTPIRSRAGELLETTMTPTGGFHISCFERFAGSQLNPRISSEWNDGFLIKLGRSLGRIHRVTDEFTLEVPRDREPWWETEMHNFPYTLPPVYDRPTVDAMQAFLAHLKDRPTCPRHFGLIHHDIHSGNILVHNGEVQVIDFDLACYGWRATDFAVLLFSHYFFPSLKVPNASARNTGLALAAMVRGYREEYAMDREQIAMIPDLLRLRETLCYNIMRPEPDYWNTAMGKPTPSAAESMAWIEEHWRQGAHFEIDLDLADE